jgi:4-diphosphocytidyl-2-C-methyl-D-erythritol kinase
VIYFPPAKINLGLKIIGKREDGFHEIQSLFLPINWCDVLEVIVVENGKRGELNFTCSGIKIPEDNSSNTVVRAHKLLSKNFNLPEIDAQLLKIIPIGAGLGGGSSDGSFMLKAINELCKLGVSNKELKSLASELGSDCPFFIDNIPSIVSGRGEIIDPLPFSIEELNINKLSILLIHPGIHVNTGVAFTLLNQELSNKKLQFLKLPSLPLNQWKEVLHNDLQIPVVSKHAEISNAINIIEDSNAEYVQMTGSGSSVFGLYQTENHDEDFINTAIKKAKKLGFTTYFGAL